MMSPGLTVPVGEFVLVSVNCGRRRVVETTLEVIPEGKTEVSESIARLFIWLALEG